MDRKEILKLAKESRFELSEDEINKFQEEFKFIKKQYDVLEQFDTEGFEPLFSILEDEVENRFNKDEVVSFDKEGKSHILDKNKMVEDYYQVPNKEGN